MKYLKVFESIKEITEICNKYGISRYTINNDGSIDVNGDVSLYGKNLQKLPLKFKNVTGNFNCAKNYLKSLEGCPQYVGGDFSCGINYLTSLNGCPIKINGDFFCVNTRLESLEGCPEEVGGSFIFSENQLKSLEGCPKKVGGNFACNNNHIKSLEGGPQFVGGHYNCSYNYLTTLNGSPVKINGDFSCTNNKLESLEYGPDEVDGMLMCSSNKLTSLGKYLPKACQNSKINFNDNPFFKVFSLFRYREWFIKSLECSYLNGSNIYKIRFEDALDEFNIELPDKIEGYTYI